MSPAMIAAASPTLDPSFLLSAIGWPTSTLSASSLAPLCDLFLREMEGRLEALRAAFDRQETCAPGEDVDFLMHAIRGSASHFGALRLVQIVGASEAMATPQWADVALATMDLEDELARVRTALADLVRQTSAKVA